MKVTSDMKTMVQIRNVPGDFHRRLKARAAMEGMSMSAYILREVGKALDLQRHAHEPLLERIWDLRQNLTAYDAVYVALAEVLGCAVLTSDAPFSRAPGMTARVVLIRA